MRGSHSGTEILSGEFRISSNGSQSALVLRAAERVGAVAAFSLKNSRACAAHSEGDSQGKGSSDFIAVANGLDIDPASVFFPRQVHSDRVEILDSPRQPGEADAVITPVPGLFLAVHTADCVPVLLLDPEKRIAAAVHAGWKGTLLRITRKTVRMMSDVFGCDPAGILAAVGPSIGPCCYEVGDEVIGAFHEGFPSAGDFMLSGADATAAAASHVRLPGGKVFHAARVRGKRPERVSRRLDLINANRAELLIAGIPANNVHVVGLCTACYPELFHSYRRDNGKTGRHVAVTGFRA